MPNSPTSDYYSSDHFIVCGLGRLGQHCVVGLKEFGVVVSGIDWGEPTDWEIPQLPTLLQTLVRGDFRQRHILEQAGIRHCRAVLLVASDERVNIEAAFAIRLLNRQVRLIVRSRQQNLNQLLDEHLGDFVAFEATQLSAPAFAIAALGSEMRGLIALPESPLRVLKTVIHPNHPWNQRRLSELNTTTRRVITHVSAQAVLPTEFYQWHPQTQVQTGDSIAYVETIEHQGNLLSRPKAPTPKSPKTGRSIGLKRDGQRFRYRVKERLKTFWASTAKQQIKRLLIVLGIVLLGVFLVGIIMLKIAYPQQNFLVLLYTVGVMLLGAYDAVFGVFDPANPIPLWLRFMNLAYMLIGTAAIAVLYALLTERLLAAKFEIPQKRPPIPTADHVVLIGSGRVGQGVVSFLQPLKQPIVGVSDTPLAASVWSNLPLVVSELTSALTKVNIATARSVVVVTDDEMTNLEIGLMAHAANPECAIAIRLFNPQFGDSITQLVPFAKVLNAYELSAQGVVASAFGESVLSLIRLNEQTVLAIEYEINDGDTLHNLLLAEIAYGYGVLPISHQRGAELARLMPPDDIRTQAADRLVLLTTVSGLQRIERGDRLKPDCWVQIERAIGSDAIFDGARTIACITGCTINEANQLMQQLPRRLPLPLYPHQAHHLVQALRRAQITTDIISSI
jgi:voltage-gated potassium channel Kch